MGEIGSKLLLVLFFITVAGIFVAAEIALVSLRDSQVQQLSNRGRRGRVLAKLMENPTRFLAAAQVGITFTSFISAGLGASEIAPLLEPYLQNAGLEGSANTIAFVGMTLVTAYFSLVIGELVPKRLAIQRAESLALTFAIPVEVIARATKPFIWLLTVSTNLLLRLLGSDPKVGKESISGEELRDIVAAHEELTEEERELIDEVFEAQDRELREVMTPRTEVEFVEGEMAVFQVAKQIAELPHSRYPVIGDSPDDVLGFVHIRDIFAPDMAERSLRMKLLARTMPVFPGTKLVIPTLQEMRKQKAHIALVIDEYGGTAGIVTLEDLVEEIIGDIRDEYDAEVVASGEHVIDGTTNLEDVAADLDLELPEGPYETVAGFIVAQTGQLPAVGQRVEINGFALTVVEVENRRATRIRVERLPEAQEAD